MLTDQVVLVLIFKAINLCIMVALAAYSYVRYLKPLLEKILHDLYLAYQHLQKAKNALDEQQREIDEKTYTQELLTQELARKAQQWHAVVMKKKELQEKENHIIQQRLSKQDKEQQHYMLIEYLRKRVGIDVIHEMQDELTQSFADTAQEKAYLHTVITAMKDYS